jgi:hypothetical protein
VGPEDGGDPAVQIPAHRDLLAGELGVEVDDHSVGLTLEALEDRVDLGEWGARDVELDRAAEVDHRDASLTDLDHRVAASGVGVRIVGGPDHAVGAVEVLVDLAMLVDVVAGRDHVGARGKHLLRRPLGDPQASGRVLAVDDHEVGRVAFAQLRHRRREPLPTRASDHVSDEEHAHQRSVSRCRERATRSLAFP